MKAAVLERLNSPLTIHDLELTELQIGQVLVKVLVSGICGSQLHEVMGHKGNEKFLPHLMGHEGCGIVEAVGPGVSKLVPGDKVVMHWRLGSGIESTFPKYLLNGKLITTGKVNTLTEKAICSENRLTKVPQETPNDLAALLGCSITTAFGIINNETDIKFGESVLVIGAGGVGLNLIQGARISGAGKIVAMDPADKKSIAKIMGANIFVRKLEEIFEKFDIILDTSGNLQIISNIFSLLSDSGRLILIGQPEPNSSLNIEKALSFFNGAGLAIKATQGGKTRPEIDIVNYLKLMEHRGLEYQSLITNRFNLSEVNLAFDLLRSGSAGRIMIDMEE